MLRKEPGRCAVAVPVGAGSPGSPGSAGSPGGAAGKAVNKGGLTVTTGGSGTYNGATS